MSHAPSRTTRSLGWWAVAFATFVTPIDFGTFGDASESVLKWVIRFPVWYLPLVLIAGRWAQLLQAIRRPPVSWLLLWAVIGTVSVAWSIDAGQTILGALAMASLALLAMWFVYLEGWDSFALAVVCGGGAVVAGGLLVNAAEGTLTSSRAGGLMTTPTTFARVAALTVLFAAMLLWRRRAVFLPLAAIAVCVPAMVFAQTRTPVVGLFAAVLYGATQRLPRQHRFALVAIVIAGAVAVTLGLGAENLSREADQTDLTTFTGRVDIWPLALDIASERPIAGHGVTTSDILFADAATQGRIGFDPGTAHMFPIAIAISTGVLGLSVFAVAFASAFLRRRRVDAWVVAPMILILINGLVESIINVPSVSFIVLAGVLGTISFTDPSPAVVGATIRSAHATTALRPQALTGR